MRDLFVGREVERQAYQRLLTDESPWVMVVTGMGGCGKTWLLDSLDEPNLPDICVVKPINFSNELLRTDPLKVLDQLAYLVAPHCDPQQVNAFKKALKENRERLMERIQVFQSQSANLGDHASLQGANWSITLADVIESNRREARALATEAFYAQMNTFDLKRLVIRLDACEWFSEPEGQNVGQWILEGLLPELHTRMQQHGQHCSVVIASRIRPQLRVINSHDYTYHPLPMLTSEEVDHYLEQKGMQDSKLRNRVYEMTYGHAGCVSIVGEIWQKRREQLLSIEELQETFYDQALESFVKEDILDDRLKSPFRELTRYGVLLRSFNLPLLQTVFQKLSPRLTIDNFYQFIRYPYIKPSVRQYYAFFELLRELQAQEIREQEPEEWKRYHQLAKDYFIQEPSKLTEWYYHTLACNEEEAKQEAQTSGDLNVLKEAARDKTLKLAGTYE